MNAERLYMVAKAVLQDLQSSQSVQLLRALRDVLQEQIKQPTNQQAVSLLRTRLLDALEKAPSNDFNPMWRQVLAESHLDRVLGRQLADRIREAFNRNHTKHSEIHRKIAGLTEDLTMKSQAISSLVKALEVLGIAAETLPAGRCELGILIPRDYVSNHLDEFGAELEELNEIFGVFQELVTGYREPLSIRGISSSDLTILLDSGAGVAALVAVTIERIVALYKQLLEIRKLHGELAKNGVPSQSLKAIEDHATRMMEAGIDKEAKEILSELPGDGDKGRRNELELELRISMRKLASRIDRGFNISVRASRDPISQEEEEETVKSLAAVRERENATSFIRTEGSPILSLPPDSGEKGRK